MRGKGRNTHTSAWIELLTEEIYKLTDEQAKGLKRATFLGMTRDEASQLGSSCPVADQGKPQVPGAQECLLRLSKRHCRVVMESSKLLGGTDKSALLRRIYLFVGGGDRATSGRLVM